MRRDVLKDGRVVAALDRGERGARRRVGSEHLGVERGVAQLQAREARLEFGELAREREREVGGQRAGRREEERALGVGVRSAEQLAWR